MQRSGVMKTYLTVLIIIWWLSVTGFFFLNAYTPPLLRWDERNVEQKYMG